DNKSGARGPPGISLLSTGSPAPWGMRGGFWVSLLTRLLRAPLPDTPTVNVGSLAAEQQPPAPEGECRSGECRFVSPSADDCSWPCGLVPALQTAREGRKAVSNFPTHVGWTRREPVHIDPWLRQMTEAGASDLYLKVGVPPMARVSGKTEPASPEALTREQME